MADDLETATDVLIRALEHVESDNIKQVMVVFINDRPDGNVTGGFYSNIDDPVVQLGMLDLAKEAARANRG